MTHLVLLHGWGTTGEVWYRQKSAFAHQNLKVLTPTFPTWEAGWLIAFLKELPGPDTAVVGWSLGGMLLLEALSLIPWRPAALVLVATPAKFCQGEDHPAGHEKAAVRAMRRALLRDSGQVLADFAARCLAPQEKAFGEEARKVFSGSPNKAYLTAGLDYLMNTDLRPCLLRTPPGAHILQGEADAVVPPAQARILARLLPKSQVRWFPGAGHLPFLTQAEAFHRMLRKILGKIRN